MGWGHSVAYRFLISAISLLKFSEILQTSSRDEGAVGTSAAHSPMDMTEASAGGGGDGGESPNVSAALSTKPPVSQCFPDL